MRTILAAALAGAAVLTLAATPATAEDCVTRFLMVDGSDDDPYVTQNPDGSVTVHPNRVRDDVNETVSSVRWLVDCIV